jgi:hypothetical protein
MPTDYASSIGDGTLAGGLDQRSEEISYDFYV